MYLDDASQLKNDLVEQFVFNRKKEIKTFALQRKEMRVNSEIKKDLFQKVNGISIIENDNRGFLKFYVDSIISRSDLALYVGVKPNDLIIANIGIIRVKTTKKRRPAWLGCSVGHYNGYAGSIGCVLKDDNDKYYILSNNHVLANSNNAVINDSILQPGAFDGGKKKKNKIAELRAFGQIDFIGRNTVDWAVGELLDKDLVSPIIPDFGPILGFDKPNYDMDVMKYGRTTKRTDGEIISLSADIKVRYGQKIAYFENQIEIMSTFEKRPKFSAAGDSGSAIIDKNTKNTIGLLFSGGDDGTTFANNIIEVHNKVKECFNFVIV